ncbi:MAG: ankyrin repeat domain-containing protein, partial [Gammaproteobacteria bacterium]|nr:ankyrin repeat domain-containing protein [Gammaproteobacteria bacterium]
LEALKLLLQAGADVNQGNHEGTTPIMYALSKKNHGAVELLIQAGAVVQMGAPLIGRF